MKPLALALAFLAPPALAGGPLDLPPTSSEVSRGFSYGGGWSARGPSDDGNVDDDTPYIRRESYDDDFWCEVKGKNYNFRVFSPCHLQVKSPDKPKPKPTKAEKPKPPKDILPKPTPRSETPPEVTPETPQPSPVPLPGALVMMLAAVAGLGFLRRRPA